MFSLNLPDTCGGVESLQSSILVLQLGAAWKPGPTACVARFSLSNVLRISLFPIKQRMT